MVTDIPRGARAARSCSAAASPAATSRGGSAVAARRSSTRRTSCSTRRCCPRRRPAASSRATSTVPLRTMCPHADLLLGRRSALDPERRASTSGPRPGSSTSTYTDLVVALGSVTRMPAVRGLREHALGLKDLSDAIRLRNHVLRQIELADAAPETARAAAHVRLRRRRLRRRRGARRAAGARRPARLRATRASPACGRAGCSSTRAPHPRADAGAASRAFAGAHARPARRRDRLRHALASVDAGGADALRRPPDRDRDRRLDRRRRRQPARRAARAAARRARARRVDETLRVAGHGRRLGARRLRRGAQRGDAGRARPGHLPARAAPGAPARAQPARRAEAVPLPHARADGHARHAATASPWSGRARARRSPAGSSPAATTCCSCRSPRAARACWRTGSAAALFRRDVAELTDGRS